MTSEDRLDRIENKIDVIVDKIANVNVTLAKQHEVLVEHQRRSVANERAIDLIRRYHLKWAISILTGLAILAFNLWKMNHA